MNIYDELENLKVRARSNPELAQALLATREMKNPVSAFCRIAQEHGCTFSAMDLVSAGEDSSAPLVSATVASTLVCASVSFCTDTDTSEDSSVTSSI